MAEIPYENMGAGGIVRDVADHTLPPEIWSAGTNIRFDNNEFQKFKGSEEVLTTWNINASTTTIGAAGACTGTSAYELRDTTLDQFISSGVQPGDWVQNTTTLAWARVVEVVNEYILELDADIFTTCPNAYQMYEADTERPLWLMPWKSLTDNYWLLGMNEKIYRVGTTTSADFTRSASDYVDDTDKIWSGGVLGGVPIMNHDAGDPPQSWDGSLNMQDLPNWPANTTCKILRTFKEYLIALDVTASGTRYPHMIKWSSPAAPGSVPSYWDNADTNDSNEKNLSDGGGFVIDAEPLGDLMIVYKEDLTYGMEWIGGPYVFRIYKLPFQHGIYAPRCAKEFFGRHFVVTKGDVIIHNGQEAESVIDEKNRDYLFDRMALGKERKTFVAPNFEANEMWICYVSNEVDGDYADEALVWNWKRNTWGHRTLANVPHIGFGTLDKDTVEKIVDLQTQIIDSDTSLVDGAAFSGGKKKLLGCPPDTPNYKLTEYDLGNDEFGTAMSCSVERTGLIAIGRDRQGNPKLDPTSTKLLRRIYPKLRGSQDVNVYVGAQQRMEGSVTWLGPFAFNPETDNHIDCRIQGKALAVKFESTTDIDWQGTGFVLDLEVIGESNW